MEGRKDSWKGWRRDYLRNLESWRIKYRKNVNDWRLDNDIINKKKEKE